VYGFMPFKIDNNRHMKAINVVEYRGIKSLKKMETKKCLVNGKRW